MLGAVGIDEITVGLAGLDAYTSMSCQRVASSVAEVAGQHLESGALVSRYEIVEVLGSGGFGITYRAFDTRLQCEVAVKEYLPIESAVRCDDSSVKPRGNDVAELYQEGLTRFLDEARVLAKFKNRHIVRVSDYMEANGTAYLVMDYEEGQPLTELLKQRGGTLSETEIKDLFIPVLDGLKAVHDAGLLHRDIKPDNIYLRRDGPPVLLDFGAARQYTANQTRNITAIVTPGYAPFEQYYPNGVLGAWTDLYAIGATIYHCVSGKPPLDALARQAGGRVDPLPPAIEVGGDRYSGLFLQTLDWMLRQPVEERPGSVDEVMPCIQGRAEPPIIQTTDESLSQVQPAATVRIPAPETIAVGATQRRPATGPTARMRPSDPFPGESIPSAKSNTGPGMALVTGIAVAVLVVTGAVWWFLQDQKDKQVDVEQKQEVIRQNIAEQEAARLATVEAGREAERKAQAAEQLALAEAEPKAAEAAQKAAAEEALRKAFVEAETARLAQAEAERKAQEEAASKAELEAEKLAAEEAARKAQAEAEAARLAQAEAERKAAEEAERLARAEAERKAEKEVARKAEQAAEKQAAEQAAQIAQTQAEAARLAQAEAERKAAAEAEQLMQAEAARKAEQEAARQAQADADLLAAEQADPEIAGVQQGDGSGNKANQVTTNIDEFLSALLIESEQSGNTASTKQASKNTASTSTGQKSADLNELLQQAEYYFSASSLVAPEGRNAKVTYQKILAIDTANPVALAGLNKIGTVYEKAARAMLSEGRQAVSLRLVERGLSVAPDLPGLLQLQAQLQNQ